MYALEDIRAFIVRRRFLVRPERHPYLLNVAEYLDLKDRSLVLPPDRVSLIRAFMEGWKERK